MIAKTFLMTGLLTVELLTLGSTSAYGAPLIVTPGDLKSVKIEIDLKIDGIARRFQFDTGADRTMVMQDEKTSLYPSEGKASSGGASGVRFECDLIRPRTISFGDRDVLDHHVRRCDLATSSFDNMGVDLLDGQVFQLDFAGNELRLLTDISFSHPETLVRLGKGHLKMAAKLGGQSLNAIFDTGAQLTSVDSEFVQKNPDLFKKVVSQETGHDISGKPVILDIYELVSVDFGDLHLESVQVAAFDFGDLRTYLGADAPLILGANAIVQANWQLDLKLNQWAVSPHAQPIVAP